MRAFSVNHLNRICKKVLARSSGRKNGRNFLFSYQIGLKQNLKIAAFIV